MVSPEALFWYVATFSVGAVPFVLVLIYLETVKMTKNARNLSDSKREHGAMLEDPTATQKPSIGLDLSSSSMFSEKLSLDVHVSPKPPIFPETLLASATPRTPIISPISGACPGVLPGSSCGIIDVLVHNVSHMDMVLNIGGSNGEWNVAKPRFNFFGPAGELILDAIQNLDDSELKRLNVPSLESVDDGMVLDSDAPRETRKVQVPCGFDLSPFGLSVEEKLLKFSSREKPGPNSETGSNTLATVSAVYFPLVATLVRKWVKRNRDEIGSEKIIYLVTGVGTPIDSTMNAENNSTLPAAKLMKIMIELMYPNIKVQTVHSKTNLFRYDENIVFVKRDLLPRIDDLRNELARTTDTWQDHLKLTVSFADGSSARVGAINASLRNYRPNYMHFWQLKRFWKQQRLCDEDVEYHTFTEIATIPAVPVEGGSSSRVTQEAKMVIDEMIKFRKEFHTVRCLGNTSHDLAAFWMRKSQKPVLSVLLVRKENGEHQLIRGTNMEVSMPTGSLCAERNAIGSALGQNLSLKRKNIIGVAVLGTRLKNDEPFSPSHGGASPPHRLSRTNSRGSLNDGWDDPAVVFPPHGASTPQGASPPTSGVYGRDGERSGSVASTASEVSTASEGERDKSQRPRSESQGTDDGFGIPAPIDVEGANLAGTSPAPSPSRLETRSLRRMASSNGLRKAGNHRNSTASTIGGSAPHETRGLMTQGAEKKRGRVVKTIVVSPGDRNPLRPCGACTEWLKKIAQVNPRFFVITFTDEDCSGFYLEEIDSAD